MTHKAIILARGLGKRMRAADALAELTPEQRRAADSGVKAMMPIAGRPFLDYVLTALVDAGVDDVALVVAPEHDLIRAQYAGAAPPRPAVSFVVQPEPRGTADAVLAAERWTDGAGFLVLNADNLYPVEALRDLASLDEPGLLVFERDELVRSSGLPDARIRGFALLEIDRDGYLEALVEKPSAAFVDRAGPKALVSMNGWRFDSRIFSACRDVPKSARGEFELPEAVALAVSRGVRIKGVPARGPVLDLSTRADASEVERRLRGM
jgi:dTDP-glucose pyrophosphorylase